MNEYQSQSQTPPQIHIIKQETSALAIISLVCGIGGWLGFHLIGVFIVGAICGHLALSRIKNSSGMIGGRGIAIAGLVLNYAFAGILLLLIFFTIVYWLLGKV